MFCHCTMSARSRKEHGCQERHRLSSTDHLRASRCARVRNLSHLSRPWSSHFTSQDCCQFCFVSDRMYGPNFYSSHRTWQALSHGSTASTSSRKTHHFFQFSQSVPSRKTHTRINWACLLSMTKSTLAQSWNHPWYRNASQHHGPICNFQDTHLGWNARHTRILCVNPGEAGNLTEKGATCASPLESPHRHWRGSRQK